MTLVYWDKATATLEIAWMWLPMFIAQNTSLMSDLREALRKQWLGGTDDVDLLKLHMWLIQWLCDRHPIKGLDTYLRAVINTDPGQPRG